MRRIIYLCPADDVPTGGIKVIYRHAELLASLGADAYVLHPYDTNFTCTWFSHATRLLRTQALNPATDFIIIPELWAAIFGPQCIDQGLRFGIFVQNGYLTHPIEAVQTTDRYFLVYQAADLVLAISEDSAAMTLLNYPRIDPARLVRVRYSIDSRFIAERDGTAGTEGPPCITYMPRKMAFHATLVVHALRQNLAPHWRIAPIHNVDEATVAAMLGASRIFLAFSEFEGLPLPPLEAALAGNLVIGYTGQGAREYWERPNFQEIHQGDIRDFVASALRGTRDIDASRLTHADLAPGIARLAKQFSHAAEAATLRALLGRIDGCFGSSQARASVAELV
jgi:hypothetical protein